MREFLLALFLGFIEGLTEFLPVSSTAHLLVIGDLLDFQSPPGHVFEVFIQLGAILAVIVLYWDRLWGALIGIPHDKIARNFIKNMIIGTIPALIVGAFARDWIKGFLYTTPVIIACSLIIGGIIILIFEKRITNPKIMDVDQISSRTALLIGCCQTIALIPGISRSGASIMGGLACGLSRTTAAEFSFFLAIPVMIAAVAYDVYRGWEDLIAYNHFPIMTAGFLAAFATALAVIKAALYIINRYGFVPFAWYRIFAGIFVLILAL